MMTLQWKCEMLQEQMLQKEMRNNAKGSWEGRLQTQFGVDEHVDKHVESIVTPPMER